MSTIKIGAICVSAGRAILLPVSLRSYESQTHGTKTLLIEYGVPKDQLLDALDEGCKALFIHRGCDYVAIWDDDDYSPPDRLERSVVMLEHPPSESPALVSYGAGWFCNLSTLACEYVHVEPDGHLWGGAMMFNQAAYEALGSFRGQPVPGYDRGLQAAVRGHALGRVESLGATGALPVAICHGQNMATFMRTCGENTLEDAAPGMPYRVRDAILAARSYLKARGLHVPAPEV